MNKKPVRFLLIICYSPLHASQVNDPSAYNRKSDQSPHSSQYPDTFRGERPISPLISNDFSETTSNNSGVTARTSDTEIIPTKLPLWVTPKRLIPCCRKSLAADVILSSPVMVINCFIMSDALISEGIEPTAIALETISPSVTIPSGLSLSKITM